jgi:hypothetical protein
MYAFLLFNYDYRRYTLEQWKRECSGPLLTFDPLPVLGDPELKLVLREQATGLFLVGRKDDEIETEVPLRSQLGEVDILKEFDPKCIVSGCFTMSARQLLKFSKVGQFIDGYIRSDGRRGFLFFGPYWPLKAGEYVVEIDVNAKNPMDAVVDVVSAQGKTSHMRVAMQDTSIVGGKFRSTFSLSDAVSDLEVRLFVGEKSEISVAGYKIRLAQ